MTDDRLAISFWIWGLFDTVPNGFYDDLEGRMVELKERGFNCIRVESGAGLCHELEQRGLQDTIAFAEIFNEADGLDFVGGYGAKTRPQDELNRWRSWHEEALEFVKARHPGIRFVDNAVRKDGKLQVTQNRTEVCQYYAFYFNATTPEAHPQLWQTLVKDFGPHRKQTKAYLQVHPANAWMGNVMRLELLSRAGLSRQLLDESLAYQLYMVELTGTLWENATAFASCNHGFASHGGVHVLYRDVLGLASVDTVHKTVQLRFTDLQLDRCEGSQPVPDGKVELRWRKVGGKLRYKVAVPAGYTVQVDNRSKLELVMETR